MKKLLGSRFLSFLLLHSLPQTTKWENFKLSVLSSLPCDWTLNFNEVESCLAAKVTCTRVAMLSGLQEAEVALKVLKVLNPSRICKDHLVFKAKHCLIHGECSHSSKECNMLKDQESIDHKKTKGKEWRVKRKGNQVH